MNALISQQPRKLIYSQQVPNWRHNSLLEQMLAELLWRYTTRKGTADLQNSKFWTNLSVERLGWQPKQVSLLDT